MKKYQNFLSENFHFLVGKFSVYLNSHVFVMDNSIFICFTIKFEDLEYFVIFFPACLKVQVKRMFRR